MMQVRQVTGGVTDLSVWELCVNRIAKRLEFVRAFATVNFAKCKHLIQDGAAVWSEQPCVESVWSNGAQLSQMSRKEGLKIRSAPTRYKSTASQPLPAKNAFNCSSSISRPDSYRMHPLQRVSRLDHLQVLHEQGHRPNCWKVPRSCCMQCHSVHACTRRTMLAIHDHSTMVTASRFVRSGSAWPLHLAI